MAPWPVLLELDAVLLLKNSWLLLLDSQIKGFQLNKFDGMHWPLGPSVKESYHLSMGLWGFLAFPISSKHLLIPSRNVDVLES